MRPTDSFGLFDGEQLVTLGSGGIPDTSPMPVAVYPGDDRDDRPYIRSVWIPTLAERRALLDGARVELVVLGLAQPPVALRVEGVEQPASVPDLGSV